MLIPVILSGGVGSRLWPLSRKSKPKHFMPLIDDRIGDVSQKNFISKSLLQQTVLRCNKDNTLSGPNPFTHNPIMVCDTEHRFLVADQCRELNIIPEDIILEPTRKDTAAAIILATLHIYNKYKNVKILILPSDHYMSDSTYFLNRIMEVEKYVDGKIVTFGITPKYPETAYGYVNADLTQNLGDECFSVQRFIEKPKLHVAEKLLEAQDCFWNSGMFMFEAESFLKLCQQFQPELLKHCKKTMETRYQDHEFVAFEHQHFEKIKPISVDYAIMQDVKDMVVAKYDGEWSDVGCWHGVWQKSNKDSNNNVIMGKVISNDNVDNCYLRSDSRLIVVADVENLSVIETPDAVLVTSLDNSQNLRDIVEESILLNKKEFLEHSHAHRPWGEYIVLVDNGEYKVKKLIVKPGAAMSLQEHGRRNEHWVVVQGQAEIVKEDKSYTLNINDTISIPKGMKHRITNSSKTEKLVIIEVQIGDYLGEDDIIRYQDNYGRVK